MNSKLLIIMKYFLMAIIAMATLLLFSCEKQKVNPATPEQKLIKLGTSALATGEQIALYANDSLQTGFQTISIKITKHSGIVTDATVQLSPLMDMGTMKHSSPSTIPIYNANTQMYEAGVVFTMAGSADHWKLIITINGETLTFGVEVKNAPTKAVSTFTATNGNAYVISLVPQKDFRIGINDLELFISRKTSMMEFVPAENLTLSFHPEMTSMGHGSPNNVNPVSAGQGMYKGKVNFTMSGDWRLFFDISASDELLAEDVFLDVRF